MVLTVEVRTLEGQSVGVLVAAPKAFKTGSTGFFAGGKMELDGRRYQVQVQMVEIGSKQASELAQGETAQSGA